MRAADVAGFVALRSMSRAAVGRAPLHDALALARTTIGSAHLPFHQRPPAADGISFFESLPSAAFAHVAIAHERRPPRASTAPHGTDRDNSGSRSLPKHARNATHRARPKSANHLQRPVATATVQRLLQQ